MQRINLFNKNGNFIFMLVGSLIAYFSINTMTIYHQRKKLGNFFQLPQTNIMSKFLNYTIEIHCNQQNVWKIFARKKSTLIWNKAHNSFDKMSDQKKQHIQPNKLVKLRKEKIKYLNPSEWLLQLFLRNENRPLFTSLAEHLLGL